MNKSLSILIALLLVVVMDVKAGNPDRQGEAGAYELLMNPWARSSGFHTLNTASIRGVESMRLNVSGLSFIDNTQLVFARANYLQGSEIFMNSAGLAQRVSKNGVLGLSIMSLDFGDIMVTTVNQPEGTGGQFSPNFTNIGFSYAHLFANKISVGATFRVVSESTTNISATGIALDAGIQYTNENVRLGISLRNIGTPMVYRGQGTDVTVTAPNGSNIMTLSQRSARFEMPSVLNIGAAYDIPVNEELKVSAVANFTSNSFSRDEIGGGVEVSFRNMFAIRGGYRYELGQNNTSQIESALYSGLAGGFSIEVPTNKKKPENKFGIDYSYRHTNVYQGTHNLGVRLSL